MVVMVWVDEDVVGVVGGCGDFFFFFSCGMGGRFVVAVVWVVGFVVMVENSWVEKERDKGKRVKEREEE